MNKNVQELSDQNLRKDLKSKKSILGFHIVIIMVLIGCAIFITLNKGASVFILMPFAFVFLLFRSWRNYYKIREEIKTRNFK